MATAPDPPRALLARTLVSLALVTLLIAGGWQAFRVLAGMRKETALRAPAALLPTVRVEVARRGPYREQVVGYGKARALRQSEVAAEVQGRILWADPERLQAGVEILGSVPALTPDGAPRGAPSLPLLVRIDASDLEGRRLRAQSDLLAARAETQRLRGLVASWQERLVVAREELAAADREYERVERLVPATLPRSDLDQQQLQVTLRRQQVLQMSSAIAETQDSLGAAEARSAARERDLEQAVRDAERAEVAAPFPGRVLSRSVFVGDYVRPGDPLFSLVDLSLIEVALALPASRFGEVQQGAAAVLKDSGTGEILHRGTIARIAPAIHDEHRTFLAFVEVPGTPGANPIAPGRHVLGEVEGALHPDVVAVPRSAFLGSEVLVLTTAKGQTRTVEARRPTVRRLLPGVALVSEGIADGEEFLLTNLETVSSGSRVRVAPAADDSK